MVPDEYLNGRDTVMDNEDLELMMSDYDLPQRLAAWRLGTGR